MRYKIIYTKFPINTVTGLTTDTGSRDYVIAINTAVTRIQQYHALGHELAHVFHDDLYRRADIQRIERDANKCAWTFYRLYRDGILQPPYSIERQ